MELFQAVKSILKQNFPVFIVQRSTYLCSLHTVHIENSSIFIPVSKPNKLEISRCALCNIRINIHFYLRISSVCDVT